LGLPEESEETYPADPTSPALARGFVQARLDEWNRPDLAEVACLLTSEVVTNAVLHAKSELQLRLRLTDTVLRVEIEDGTSSMRRPHWIADLADRGRGLVIVETLSVSWGVRPKGEGKVVWFHLDASMPPGDQAMTDP
jgi:anti-sigma regulatory factor (Ser/Thr protein kinase)